MKIVQAERPIFIYTLADPREPEAIRYVGQSVHPQKRLDAHLCEARSGMRSHRSNWLRQLLAAGLIPTMQIIEQTTVDTWIEREKYWIAFYRAEGYRLVNQTDGGEGTLGYSPSAEAIAKGSAARQGRKQKPETVAKRVEKLRGRKMPQSAVEAQYGTFIVTAPDGMEIEIRGLAPFCRRHGLHLSGVLEGRCTHSKGWKIRRPGEEPDPTPMKGIPAIVTGPDGEHHLVISHLTRWCEQHGVKRGALQWSELRKRAMNGWQMCRAVWMEGGWQIPEDWERWPEFTPDYTYTPERRERLSEKMQGEGNPFYGRQHSDETKAKIRAGNMGRPSPRRGKPAPPDWVYHRKTYILTDPDGREIVVSNLALFCSEHNLTRSTLLGVAAGKWSHHKGWRIRRPDQE